MPSRYAADTEVPVERSKTAIEGLLTQRGVEGYHTGWDQQRDIIEFVWKGKQIRFLLPRPKRGNYLRKRDGYGRNERQVTAAMDQANRQRWRALYLVVRAKIEAVEAGLAIFEEEFLSFIVIPGANKTIGEILVPRLGEGEFDIARLLPERSAQ
jgi:hypothetical protein